jgi:hypothetical protein
MSDIGVHSNVYQRVRDYGQLIDEVLVRLRSVASSPFDPARRRLGELLVGLQSASPPNLQTAWLGMLIGGADSAARARWARVGRALLSESIDSSVIDELEELAGRLEERRTEALTKMRGIRT